jgi:hypothetical protein
MSIYICIHKCIYIYIYIYVYYLCLIGIKTSLPATEIYQYIADNIRASFPLVRINADLQQVSKRFIAIKRRSVAFVVAKYNRKFLLKMKQDAKKYVSFRMFKQNLVTQIAKRLTVEQRIISESFDSRYVFSLPMPYWHNWSAFFMFSDHKFCNTCRCNLFKILFRL